MSRRALQSGRRVIAGSTAFSPSQAPGAVGWWRADQGITIGTGVSSWADILGLSAAFTQGTGANQPTFSASDANFNNQQSVTANGTTQFLSTTSIPLGGSTTLFMWMVTRTITTSANATWFGMNSGGTMWQIRQDNSGLGEPSIINQNTSQFGPTWGSSVSGATKAIAGYTSGTVCSLSVSNTTPATATVTSSSFATASAEMFGIAGVQLINASIAELLVCTQVPSSGFLISLQAYAQRYGAV